ncbi:unnamed protein product, partial [Amoebophrya sp. A25]|eukprot:GSA25T00010971001.1
MFPDAERLEIEGRTFPVTVHYARELIPNYDLTTPNSFIDYDAIAQAVLMVRRGKFDHFDVVAKGAGKAAARHWRRYSKAILIFMPGVGEIKQMCRVLREKADSEDGGTRAGLIPEDSILPLHASLPAAEQKRCFEVFDGKIVISTNVCETSITIPDVTCVIDCCREKRLGLRKFVMEMCTLRLPVLQEQFCSKASIEQRKGRAGRVQPGICIRMISRSYAENKLLAHTEAEMDVLPLENIILQLLVGLQDERSKKILMPSSLREEQEKDMTSTLSTSGDTTTIS